MITLGIGPGPEDFFAPLIILWFWWCLWEGSKE